MLYTKLNTQVLLTMFIIECGIVDELCKCSPISFKHVSLCCLFFDPQLITHLKYMCPIKKVTQ